MHTYLHSHTHKHTHLHSPQVHDALSAIDRALVMLSATEFRARVETVGPDSPIYTLRDLFTRGGGKGHRDRDGGGGDDEAGADSLCPVQTTRGDQWAGGSCAKSSLKYLVQTLRFALASSGS